MATKEKPNRNQQEQDDNHGLSAADHGQSASLDSISLLLVDAIRNLNEVALMDNEKLPKCQDDKIVQAQEKLAAIEEALLQKPEHADSGHALGGLTRAIYGFHSNIHALKIETDQHSSEHRRLTAEIQTLQQEIKQLQTVNRKLRSHARKISTEKDNLTVNLIQVSKDKRTLIRHAKTLAAEVDISKKKQEELQVLAHEHVLMASSMTCPRERKQTASTEESTLSIEERTQNTIDGRDVLLDCDTLSVSSTCQEPPLELTIPVEKGAVPLLLRADHNIVEGQQQIPDLTESSNSDMPQTDDDGSFAASFFGSNHAKEPTPQKKQQKGLLNDAFVGIQCSGIPSTEGLRNEEPSEMRDVRQPNAFLRGLGFHRKQPDGPESSFSLSTTKEQTGENEAIDMTNDISKEATKKAAGSVFNRPFFGLGEQEEKLPAQGEKTDESIHSTSSEHKDEELQEAGPEVGSESSDDTAKVLFPFWKKSQ